MLFLVFFLHCYICSQFFSFSSRWARSEIEFLNGLCRKYRDKSSSYGPRGMIFHTLIIVWKMALFVP